MPVLASCIANQEPKNIFTESLKLLPSDARDGRVITIINYESFRKVNGISVYDEDNQRLTKEEYIEAVVNLYMDGTLFGSDIFQYGSYWTGFKDDVYLSPIQDKNIGYNVTDV